MAVANIFVFISFSSVIKVLTPHFYLLFGLKIKLQSYVANLIFESVVFVFQTTLWI